MNIKKVLTFMALFFGAVAVYQYFDIGQYLNFTELKRQQTQIQAYYQEHQFTMMAGYFALYVFATAISLPGAVILTLAGGAIFGFFPAVILISFASSIGATLAFLVARYLFREPVQSRFGKKLQVINEGIKKDGGFYLFTLRLIPIFPFFMINLIFGLTPIPARTFYGVSQLGMLAGTAVYVNAGTQLAQLESASGIISPDVLLSFALLGLFPWIAKSIVAVVRARKIYKNTKKPRHFDYNIIVIGAGSGGLVAAYIAAVLKAKVAVIEKTKMGGDCLNTGCVPSKTLLRSAKMLHHAHRATDWGFRSTTVDFDFAHVMERVQSVIKYIEPHDSVERYQSLGVDAMIGEARIIDPFTVEVNGNTLTTRNIVIATGSRPLAPPIPGLEEVSPLTSDTIWDIRTLPKRLVVVGGGPIGSEMTQAFARFGSAVTQVEGYDGILNREDDDVSAFIRETFEQEGVTVKTGHMVKRFERDGDEKIVVCEHEGKEIRIHCDEILLALGRRANVTGFGLEELGVELRPNGTIDVDPFLRTNYPNIYACGDVTGPYQFTHFASHQAWYVSINALFSPLKKFKADYRIIPWTTFTDPEVARVGLNEKDAQREDIPYEVTTYDFAGLDRAIADGENRGFVKVLTVPNKDKILGTTIVGPHAGEIMAEYVLAMKYGLGLNKILGTIHTYPTLSEATKFAAGNWKKAHAPSGALKWLDKFHSWRRS
ncbi:MAG: dihydrolipoyl dehydrogenase [Fidelibacterota bacterium]